MDLASSHRLVVIAHPILVCRASSHVDERVCPRAPGAAAVAVARSRPVAATLVALKSTTWRETTGIQYNV